MENCCSILIRFTRGVVGLDRRFEVVESACHIVHFCFMSAVRLGHGSLKIGKHTLLYEFARHCTELGAQLVQQVVYHMDEICRLCFWSRL
jgi:hypothetical protein